MAGTLAMATLGLLDLAVMNLRIEITREIVGRIMDWVFIHRGQSDIFGQYKLKRNY